MDQLAGQASDREIVQRLQDGCDRSAGKFVRTHMPWMLKLATRILRNPDAARDAVQEAFASAFSKIGTFEHKAALKTWLHRIVVNQCLMALRRKKRWAEENLDELLPVFDETGCRVEAAWSTLVDVEDVVAQNQLQAVVQEAIDRLPESYRVILLLRDIEGLSTADVAEQLELSEANAKVRLHRARAALKKMLEPLLRGELS